MAVKVINSTEYTIVPEALPEHMKTQVVTIRHKETGQTAVIDLKEWKAQTSDIYLQDDYEEVVVSKKEARAAKEAKDAKDARKAPTLVTEQQMKVMDVNSLRELAGMYKLDNLPNDKNKLVEMLLQAQNGELARKD